MKDFYRLADLKNWEEPRIRLGVVGDPVRQSRSPAMMNAALQACCLEMEYARFQISPDELAEALPLFVAHNFIGLNFTIPHKIAATARMDELDEFARTVGAINTARIDNGKLLGSTTDGPGFAQAIREEFALELRGLHILLLGAAGGAGRAIAQQCALEGCARLVLANRDFSKAERMAVDLGVEAIEWARIESLGKLDLAVNATPVAFERKVGAEYFYDLSYLRAVSSSHSANGLSMLLHQGALAFEKWFERAAPIEVMRAALAGRA